MACTHAPSRNRGAALGVVFILPAPTRSEGGEGCSAQHSELTRAGRPAASSSCKHHSTRLQATDPATWTSAAGPAFHGCRWAGNLAARVCAPGLLCSHCLRARRLLLLPAAGFAFIYMSDDRDAKAAIKALDRCGAQPVSSLSVSHAPTNAAASMTRH